MLDANEESYLNQVRATRSLRTFQAYKASLKKYAAFREYQLKHSPIFDDMGNRGIHISYRTINIDFPRFLLDNYPKMTKQQALSVIQHLRIYFEWQDVQTGVTLKTLLNYDRFADKLYKRQVSKNYDISHTIVRKAVNHLNSLPPSPRNFSRQLATLLVYMHGFTTAELISLRQTDNESGMIIMPGRSGPRKIILDDYLNHLWVTYCKTRLDNSLYLFPAFTANSDYDIHSEKMTPRTLQRYFEGLRKDLGLNEFSPRILRSLFINTAKESMTIDELRLAMGWHKDYSGFYYAKIGKITNV